MSNAAEMDAQEIINYIATAPKKTPVKLYVREKPGMEVQWGNARVYGDCRGKTVIGDWDELKAILYANDDSIDYYDVENDCRNSAVPMLDLKGINARIEPGAIIRDRVEIGDRAVIMMGAIINIGSVGGLYPDLSRTAYGVSKAAIHFLTKDIAVQYARQGVRCNAVLPGFTATDAALNNMSQAFLELFLKNVPLNRPGRPEDIADAVAFLASDRAAFITGEILPVAGGFGLPTPLYGSYMSAGAKG